ncbi:MAG: thiopurine S-methyltransferase [Hyphomicrobium sp.]|uniref:thiopurine S-methyltransferase n=1 Tax=Hyphomicrobium sp. TaxID=82 RepID=UPI00132C8488|nr:thiopurine S-methyltransferase [Hyphomicrobium sp.]KAB2943949.1 MAG: thiopurine S-methyltransferase [Hyphomicrobium sp.]MBZ0208857.1 thiopurine S-methyltransferase [Hyphomicrobium sp.]
MDPTFWRERWRNQEIGFHQPDFHALLQEHWPRLALPQGSPVFVPLCGKSLDMVWLAQQGHRVIGAELSELAVDSFFSERGLAPAMRQAGGFTIKSAGPYELWCGDVFEMPREAAGDVAGVYDRAALIALPPPLQGRYATKLKEIVPAAAPILLVTLDYDQSQMSGPPFATPRRQVHDLFADDYACTELASRQVLEGHPHFKQRGLTALEECAFLLRRK